MNVPLRKPRLDNSPVRTWIEHKRPEAEIRAELRKMLAEQLERNRKILEGLN